MTTISDKSGDKIAENKTNEVHETALTKTLFVFPPNDFEQELAWLNNATNEIDLLKKYKWNIHNISTFDISSKIQCSQKDIDSLCAGSPITDRIVDFCCLW